MAKITGEIIIGRPVEAVFDFAADQRNELRYNPRMIRADKVSDGPVAKGTVFCSAAKSMGRAAGMRIELTCYDRPHRLASRTAMKQAVIDGALTFDPVPGGTRMRWSWSVRPRGAARLLAPVITWVGRRQEQAIWASMKRYLETRDETRDHGQPPGRGEVVAERPPLAYPAALRAMADCFANTMRLLMQRRLHLPRGRVGMRLRFADGTSARVYRETVVDRAPTLDPCVLIVEFRLRAVRGRGHGAFRLESMLNTPLFAGFPGFVSKLWLADDERGRYRGVYEWDGPRFAENYARALWRVLALVSVRGSVRYVVLPGLRRDAVLEEPHVLPGTAADAAAWWRLAEAA